MTKLDLFKFLPFRLNRLAAEVSSELASEYRARAGLDIPEWRVIATLGFGGKACTAQYISHCTRTHKSTISRAVSQLLKRRLIERVESKIDRRAFALRLTRSGRALYHDLIPRLLRKEREILSSLTSEERILLNTVLGGLERSLDLAQTLKEAGARGGY